MIPLLGMHRSGTSAMAGALHKLGADLGPETSWIPAAADNPLGFFELSAVVEVNREVLIALGGTWSSPPALPPGWTRDRRIAKLRERARELAAAFSADLIVKDPRLSLVQPLWDEVSRLRPAMICVRHPVAVAESLHRRNDLSIDESLFLWFRYNSASLLNRPEALVVEYELLISDTAQQLRRVADHIGLDVSQSTVDAAARSVREDMAHHRGDDWVSSPVGEMCSRLYHHMRAKRALQEDHELLTWARLISAIPSSTPAQRDIEMINHSLTLATRLSDRLESENSVLRSKIAELERELRVVRSDRDMRVLTATIELARVEKDMGE